MKVVGLSCSPRKGGNTEILLGEALAGAKEAGAEVELLNATRDDRQTISKKLLEADGIIIGSPAYSRNVPPRALAVLQQSLRLQNKVGAPIAVTAKTGGWNVITTLYLFFIAHHMFCADYVMGLANAKGAVRKDEFAMKGALELGKQVVALVNKGLEWPEEYQSPLYDLVSKKYGLKLSPYG